MTKKIPGKKGILPLRSILCVLLAAVLVGGAIHIVRAPSGPGGNPSKASGEPRVLFYRNPMNPAITSAVPAKDEMGMDYIAVYEDEGKTPGKTAEQETEEFFAPDADASKKGGIAGLGPVNLAPEGLALAGVVSAPAVRTTLQSEIRTVGRVVSDETRVRKIQTRVSGWVEKLFVDYTGQQVRKGDPVLRLYSPELLSSQQEYLQAIQMAKQFAGSSDPETRKFGENLRNSARQRLRLFDVPDSFVDEVEKGHNPRQGVTLVAPASGFVTGKEVFEGQKVEPGQELFVITDLSRIWVEADFYEYEAGALQTGQQAEISSSYDPNLQLKGEVSYIYPFLDPQIRTVKARIEFSNDHLPLKPGMFVDVRLMVDRGASLVVPASAVMDSGARRVVFVSLGEGRFEPRLVRTGDRDRDRVQILSGIGEGENVAVKANFLLDSESRLQAIIEHMTRK